MNNFLDRKAIIAAIIATVIVSLLILPAIKFAWPIVVWIADITWTSFLDGIYRGAARGGEDRLSFLILQMILSSMLGFVTILFVIFIKINKMDKIQKDKSNIQKRRRALTIQFSIAVPVMWLIVIFLLGGLFVQMAIRTSFDQRITVLSPVVSDQEYKEIRAQWASMKSRDDFLSVVERMERLAKSNNVTLPAPLLE